MHFHWGGWILGFLASLLLVLTTLLLEYSLLQGAVGADVVTLTALFSGFWTAFKVTSNQG